MYNAHHVEHILIIMHVHYVRYSTYVKIENNACQPRSHCGYSMSFVTIGDRMLSSFTPLLFSTMAPALLSFAYRDYSYTTQVKVYILGI